VSQRDSGYKRKRNDNYATPDWVTKAICPYISIRALHVWEVAPGAGHMVKSLKDFGLRVWSSPVDFLTSDLISDRVGAIVTNPPFGKSQEFIEHALELMKPQRGVVAMLLRIDYDSAKTRQRLFKEHPAWHKKLVLTRRIIWFKKKGAAPSYNHAWYIWDWRHRGPPTIDYYVE
jgi:hypothetical protein